MLLSRRDDALVEDDILAMICWLNEELGVGVNEKTRDGRTALHYACLKRRLLVSQWLEERGAEMDARDRFGLNALHHAVLGGHASVVSWLVNMGVDRTRRDRNGKTPLDLCTGTSPGSESVRALLTPALKDRASSMIACAGATRGKQTTTKVTDEAKGRNVASPSTVVQWFA